MTIYLILIIISLVGVVVGGAYMQGKKNKETEDLKDNLNASRNKKLLESNIAKMEKKSKIDLADKLWKK